MKKVELEQKETELVLQQLSEMPMNRVENLVLFFRNKLQEAKQAEEVEEVEEVVEEVEVKEPKAKKDKE